MKWHEHENQRRYNEMAEKGLTNRYEVHDGISFVQQLHDSERIENLFKKAGNPPAKVLVIGTGTGADACILDSLGYDVTAIDIIDKAIEQAIINAETVDAKVTFIQDDVLNPKHTYGKYDIIFSSYCLQSIVTDADREKYYDFVKRHLTPDGQHAIISAGYSPKKDYTEDIRDEKTGIVYWKAPEDFAKGLEDIKVIDGIPYASCRRHFTIDQLCDELIHFGFLVQYVKREELGIGELIAIASLAD